MNEELRKKYPGWYRVDLHSHTTNEILVDRKERKNKYSHEAFYKYILEQNVDLKVVTNHNTLNLCDHIKQALICDKANIKYLCGVELDLCFYSKRFHGVVILSPEIDIVKYSRDLEAIVSNKIKDTKASKILLNEEDFSKLHENTSFIFIPHAIKVNGIFYEKNPRDNDAKTIDWVLNSIRSGMSAPILFENTHDYNKYSLINKIKQYQNDKSVNFQVGCIVNSDYNFDSDEEREKNIKQKAKYCIFSIPTYRGLEIAIRNFNTRLSCEEDIVSIQKYIKEIEFNDIDNISFKIGGKIFLSTGLNVIIGNSGTGKTLLLNEIFRFINKKDISNSIEKKSLNHGMYYNKTHDNILSLPDIENIKAIEIPKIYEKILKCSNSENIGEQFGVTDMSVSTEIINDYKKCISKYEILKKQTLEDSKNGNLLVTNIIKNTDFIINNRTISSIYNLICESYNSNSKERCARKKEEIRQILSKEISVKIYFGKIVSLTENTEIKEAVTTILKEYDKVIINLKKELKDVEVNLKFMDINERLFQIVNLAIKKQIDSLGEREKNFKKRKAQKAEDDYELSKVIISNIKATLRKDIIYCGYPYEKLCENIEKNNANKYARLTIKNPKEDMRDMDLASSDYINNNNIKGALRSIGNVDMLDSSSMKSLDDKLLENNISLSEIIEAKIPLVLEIKDDGEWKKTNNINPGSLAKRFMEYFFTKIIDEQQPDVIFIDQPENDVDKTFITESLSEFIRKNKTTKQFIITTHDPIIAVNSDANLIIKASLDDNNKINYSSFLMEDIDENDYSFRGTDIVSKTLDGGKENVKLRYQIYGGGL